MDIFRFTMTLDSGDVWACSTLRGFFKFIDHEYRRGEIKLKDFETSEFFGPSLMKPGQLEKIRQYFLNK